MRCPLGVASGGLASGIHCGSWSVSLCATHLACVVWVGQKAKCVAGAACIVICIFDRPRTQAKAMQRRRLGAFITWPLGRPRFSRCLRRVVRAGARPTRWVWECVIVTAQRRSKQYGHERLAQCPSRRSDVERLAGIIWPFAGWRQWLRTGPNLEGLQQSERDALRLH